MRLRLITADYEAAEASRKARLDLATSYEIAVHAGDEPGVRYIETLAADIDAHNPFGPRLLDEIRGHLSVAEVA